MPWCDPCSKYMAPTALNEDGTCPECGETVGEVEQRAGDELAATGTPWHFKLLLIVLVVYLGYRLYQGIVWLL